MTVATQNMDKSIKKKEVGGDFLFFCVLIKTADSLQELFLPSSEQPAESFCFFVSYFFPLFLGVCVFK